MSNPEKEYEKLFTKFYGDLFKFQSGKKTNLKCPGCDSKKRFIIDNDKLIGTLLELKDLDFIPKKNSTTHATDEKALTKWARGFFVDNLFQPKKKTKHKAISTPLIALKNTISQIGYLKLRDFTNISLTPRLKIPSVI